MSPFPPRPQQISYLRTSVTTNQTPHRGFLTARITPSSRLPPAVGRLTIPFPSISVQKLSPKYLLPSQTQTVLAADPRRSHPLARGTLLAGPPRVAPCNFIAYLDLGGVYPTPRLGICMVLGGRRVTRCDVPAKRDQGSQGVGFSWCGKDDRGWMTCRVGVEMGRAGIGSYLM